MDDLKIKQMRMLVWDHKMSHRQIARICGVHEDTVRKYCKDVPTYKAKGITVAERSELLRGWR